MRYVVERVGGGGGHPNHEITRGTGIEKKFFSALRASVWFKNKGGGGGPTRALPVDPPLVLPPLRG